MSDSRFRLEALTTSKVNAVSDPELGEAITIREVAVLLGCSPWTVRQRHLPSGLPYFRIGSSGKFVFYRNQVIRWILSKQHQKGGMSR